MKGFLKFVFKVFLLMLIFPFVIGFLRNTGGRIVFFGLLIVMMIGSAAVFYYLVNEQKEGVKKVRPWFRWYFPMSCYRALFEWLELRQGKLIQRRGLIRRREIAVPIGKIQNYDFVQPGIFDRMFGRASYAIMTAGHGGVEMYLRNYPLWVRTWLDRQVE